MINIVEAVLHPHFDRIRLINDFAALKFENPIDFDQFTKPIELPGKFDKLADGTECKVGGWGKMEDETKPRELRAVTVYIVNPETCQQNYNTTRVKFRIASSMLCAGVEEGQKDACSGDSVSLLTIFLLSSSQKFEFLSM